MGDMKSKRRRQRRAAGQGCVYRRPGAKVWSIKWEENGATRYKSGYPTEELARQTLAVIAGNIIKRESGLPVVRPVSPPLGELFAEWYERRRHTHSSHADDRNRWARDLAPKFGRCRPDEVGKANVRAFIEQKLRQGLSPATVLLLVRLGSTFYSDLVERDIALSNPFKGLPRATAKLLRSTHVASDTRFVEKLADVRRVYLALRDTFIQGAVAYAIGAFAGLRPGEIIALRWERVDLDRRRIAVREQVRHGQLGPVKDKEGRDVPIQRSLLPILAEWKLATGGAGLLFRPAVPTRGRESTYLKLATLHKHLREAFEACGIPPMSWYEASRHTFGSHWVLSGGSMEKLSKVLGHSSVTTTEKHYVHLRPDLYTERDNSLLDVDLSAPTGQVVALQPVAGSCNGVADEVSSSGGSKVTS